MSIIGHFADITFICMRFFWLSQHAHDINDPCINRAQDRKKSK